MTAKLQEALTAFRELAQERHRLECEIVEVKAQLEGLYPRLGDIERAYDKARRHIVALASGVPCEGCGGLPVYSSKPSGEMMHYRCEGCAVEAGWSI